MYYCTLYVKKEKKKRLNSTLIWSIFFSCHLPIWRPQCTSIWADWAVLCWCAWISEWEWAECSFYSLQSWQGKELIPVIEPWLFTRENIIRAKNSFDMKLITALLHVESLWLSGSVSIWVQNPKLKVWLLTRTQNFFIVQCLWQDKRIFAFNSSQFCLVKIFQDWGYGKVKLNCKNGVVKGSSLLVILCD